MKESGQRLKAFGLVVLVIAASCTNRSPRTLAPAGLMDDSRLTESSGLVVSRLHTNVFWTHNDEGEAELFAIKEKGELIRSFTVPTAVNRDWESIASDSSGNLYLLDNTSRESTNSETQVYIVREPDPVRDHEVRLAGISRIRFPDGGHDCEAMFFWDGFLYFVTKPWDGSRPRLYRFADIGRDGEAEFLAEVPVSAMITGADIDADGRRIALSSYRAIFVFEGDGGPEETLQSEPLVCRLNARQVESIAWKNDDLFITNEEREIFHVPPSHWQAADAPFLEGPTEWIPFTPIIPAVEEPLATWKKGFWLRATGTAGGKSNIGRVVWTNEGLHVGIQLPGGLELKPLNEVPPNGFADWFIPGRVYLLLNPSGERPLTFGPDDRCLVLGLSEDGNIMVQSRLLLPATVIERVENRPHWVSVSHSGRRILLTINEDSPTWESVRNLESIGFNVIVITEDGEMLSWSPLTLRFSFDNPSTWGLMEIRNP